MFNWDFLYFNLCLVSCPFIGYCREELGSVFLTPFHQVFVLANKIRVGKNREIEL